MDAQASTPTKVSSFRLLSFPVAIGTILVLWLAYTGLVALDNTGRIEQPFIAILECVFGLLGVGVMLASGFKTSDCFLRLAPLSKKGLLAFAILSPLLLPVFFTGVWAGWNPVAFLVYAPATALSQELFFRCAVFPLFLRFFKGRLPLAIFLAALLHGLWHVGPLSLGAPWFNVLPVMVVPFLAGLVWNWQVQHDRTIFWVMIYHLLIDQGMSLFSWG